MKWIQPVRLLEVDVLENFAYKWLGYSTPENKQEWRPTKIYLMHERICFGNQAWSKHHHSATLWKCFRHYPLRDSVDLISTMVRRVGSLLARCHKSVNYQPRAKYAWKCCWNTRGGHKFNGNGTEAMKVLNDPIKLDGVFFRVRAPVHKNTIDHLVCPSWPIRLWPWV